MTPTLLCLLSPYRPPTRHALQLNADEVAAWLNGYLALWHPAALVAAPGLPRAASSYDHDFPKAGQVFAVPVAPQLFQADDWPDRRDAAGAVSFSATPDRGETLAGLLEALRKLADVVPASERPPANGGGESTQYPVPSPQSETPAVPPETPSGNGTEHCVPSTDSAAPLARMRTLLDAAPEHVGWFRAV